MLFLVTMFKWNQQLLEYYWRRRNMKREIITSVKKSETKAGSFFFCCFGNFLFQKMISDGNTFPVARRKLGGDSTALPNAGVNSTRWKLVTKSLIFFPSGVGPFLYLFDKLRSQKFCGTLLWLGKQVETSLSFKLSLLLRKNSIFGAISIQNLVLIPDLNDATSQMLSILGKVRKPTLVSFWCGLKKVKYK